MHLKLHGKHLSYALVQDTQKGGATSSHHPRLTCIPPSSLGQSAARLPRFTMSKWLLSSFIPLHGFCRCFCAPSVGCASLLSEQIPAEVAVAPGGTKFILLVTTSQQHPSDCIPKEMDGSGIPKAQLGQQATIGLQRGVTKYQRKRCLAGMCKSEKQKRKKRWQKEQGCVRR